MDDFQAAHDRDEFVLVNYDFADPFWASRTAYYGITSMPTVAGDGVSMADAWTGLEADLASLSAVESPLSIALTENGEGDFTAHIVAEETVTDARFCMVAVLDEYVPAFAGATSHLAYHATAFMTDVTGDPFSLGVGESADVHGMFTVDPAWDYEKMGVACWVQVEGGTNPGGSLDLPAKNNVLQSAFLATGQTGIGHESAALASLSAPRPNPLSAATRMSYTLERHGDVALMVHDVAGRMVAEIARGTRSEGTYQATWDGNDSTGRPCASGVYFVRLVVDGRAESSRKLVVLR